MSCGGVGEAKEPTKEVQDLCESLKSHAEGKANKTFSEFSAISFSTQVVAGTNYFVKVHVGNDECVHVRIFKPLPHTGGAPELHSIQADKTREDTIEHF